VLLAPQALERGFFAEGALRKMVADHVAQRRDYSQQLWALLMLEAFLAQGDKR
jgi:hypothetical protein